MKLIVILTSVVLLTYSCSREKNHPGYKYWPEMTENVAYNTFTENPVMKDGKTLQEPIKGTVPRNFIPYQFSKNSSDRQIAGQKMKKPYLVSDSIIKEGKELFNFFCKQCHGIKGDGKGFLYTKKFYPYPPANLLSDKLKQVTDGEIYHVASVGFNLMGAHASMLNPNERWKIVCYVRELQKTP
jgi:mono/diheme cytochrome c family protein